MLSIIIFCREYSRMCSIRYVDFTTSLSPNTIPSNSKMGKRGKVHPNNSTTIPLRNLENEIENVN